MTDKKKAAPKGKRMVGWMIVSKFGDPVLWDERPQVYWLRRVAKGAISRASGDRVVKVVLEWEVR